MEASEATQPQEQAQPEPAQEAAPQPSAFAEPAATAETPPDLGEQVAALQQQVTSLRGQVAPEPQQPANLYDQLSTVQQDGGYQQDGLDQYGEPVYGEPQGYDPNQNPEVDPFEDAIRERVAEAMSPVLQSIETDRRRGQLEEIAKEHPALRDTETQEAIAQVLGPLAERYGNEMLMTDPELVQAVLVNIQATKAAAGEVPAEQAANQGAQLETAAGASAPQAELGPDEAIAKGIVNAGAGSNAFA